MVSTPVTKSLDEIHALIVEEVRKNHDFDEVTPLRPHWHAIDQDGCNWDLSHWRGPAELAMLAREAIAPAVLEMRRMYRAPTP